MEGPSFRIATATPADGTPESAADEATEEALSA